MGFGLSPRGLQGPVEHQYVLFTQEFNASTHALELAPGRRINFCPTPEEDAKRACTVCR